MHRAAAVLTFLCPGLRFFHDGQFEGKTKKLSVHLGRRPSEAVELPVRQFYDRLLDCVHQPAIRNGDWRLLDCSPAWDGNWTWDCFIGFAWQTTGELPVLIITNYAANQSQCYFQAPFEEMRGHKIRLQDLMSLAVYERDDDELLGKGLYLDIPPWGYHVFKLSAV